MTMFATVSEMNLHLACRAVLDEPAILCTCESPHNKEGELACARCLCELAVEWHDDNQEKKP